MHKHIVLGGIISLIEFVVLFDAVVDAFSHSQISRLRLRSDSFTSSSDQLPIQTQLSASSSSSDSSNKSLFEQAFGVQLQMPWDNNLDGDAKKSKSQHHEQQQRFQNNSSSSQRTSNPKTTSAANNTPRKKRKPRVPLYPSALQVNMTPDAEHSPKHSEEDIDNYMQSAMTAAKDMSINTDNSDLKQDGKMKTQPDKDKRVPKLGI